MSQPSSLFARSIPLETPSGQAMGTLFCREEDQPLRRLLIYCPPLLDEEAPSHRPIVEGLLPFAAAGLPVLYLQYTGTGTTPGGNETLSLEGCLQSLEAACRWALSQKPEMPPTIDLLGLRGGATIAFLAAERLKKIPVSLRTLTLWEPVLNGTIYLEEIRRHGEIRTQLNQGVATGGSHRQGLDFGGFFLTPTLQEALRSIQLNQLPPLAIPLTLAQIGPWKMCRPEMAAFAARHHIPAERTQVFYHKPFWRQIDFTPIGEELWKTLPVEITPQKNISPAINSSSGYQLLPGSKSELIVFLHGWSGYGPGPHRLLLELAQRLNTSGYSTLTFDLPGRGDAEGEFEKADLDQAIEGTLAAIRRANPAGNITLVGLCSGGSIALGAAGKEARVHRVVALSTLPLMPIQSSKNLRRKFLSRLGGYFRKALRPATWRRLFQGALQWQLIGKALSLGAEREEGRSLKNSRRDILADLATKEIRYLFVYGGNDPDQPEAWAFYEEFFRKNNRPARLEILPGANHNFSSIPWKKELLHRIEEFLRAT